MSHPAGERETDVLRLDFAGWPPPEIHGLKVTSEGVNDAVPTDPAGAWIDRVHDCRPPGMVGLDMNASVSPTYGNQRRTT